MFDEDTKKFYEIFHPHYLDKIQKIHNENNRFVYYTSADTALKIIRNSELWFRNATVMNDVSEIDYGIRGILDAFSSDAGQIFRDAANGVFPDTIQKVNDLFESWKHDWRLETYIACVSVHDPSEDRTGRLSMWRAYGNTALVINNEPLMAVTDILKVYSIPVSYLTFNEIKARISAVANMITQNTKYFQSLGQDYFIQCIHQMLFIFAIATKHPGFHEEQEWRIYYRPSDAQSPAMVEEIVVLNGVAQKVFKLQLADDPENGLHGAAVPSLLNRLIIGPTQYPYASYAAFIGALDGTGVVDASSKVICSDIPLRVG